MTNEQILSEMRDVNLTYLILAQKLIKEDRVESLFRLGISDESATLIAQLSMSQLLRIASSNMLLCRFRVDDEVVWDLLTHHNVGGRVDSDMPARLQASIAMAGNYADAM